MTAQRKCLKLMFSLFGMMSQFICASQKYFPSRNFMSFDFQPGHRFDALFINAFHVELHKTLRSASTKCQNHNNQVSVLHKAFFLSAVSRASTRWPWSFIWPKPPNLFLRSIHNCAGLVIKSVQVCSNLKSDSACSKFKKLTFAESKRFVLGFSNCFLLCRGNILEV